MRLVICWPVINGYMAACWRALAARGVKIRVIAYDPAGQSHTAYGSELMSGLDHHFLTDAERRDPDAVARLVADYYPNVLYVPGWGFPAYNRLVYSDRLAGCRFIMGMDTPWLNTWRQRFAWIKLKPYLNRMDRIVAIGERAFQAARRMGAPERKIRRLTYAGIDYQPLKPLLEQRLAQSGGWPRRFLFIGRYVEVKALDVLIEAFNLYRSRHDDPWSLSCCGKGPLAHRVDSAVGVTNHGFIQPADLPDIWRTHGVFVNAARYDPWPLVIVEACGAGLPVIASEACGSAVELVRPYYNGVTVATGEVEPLARAMSWMHEHYDRLPDFGRRARQHAEACTAEQWAERWVNMLEELQPTAQARA